MLLYDRVLSAVLNRFEDYEVDRRGDVGSFVREHCLMCAARMVVALRWASPRAVPANRRFSCDSRRWTVSWLICCDSWLRGWTRAACTGA